MACTMPGNQSLYEGTEKELRTPYELLSRQGLVHEFDFEKSPLPELHVCMGPKYPSMGGGKGVSEFEKDTEVLNFEDLGISGTLD